MDRTGVPVVMKTAEEEEVRETAANGTKASVVAGIAERQKVKAQNARRALRFSLLLPILDSAAVIDGWMIG